MEMQLPSLTLMIGYGLILRSVYVNNQYDIQHWTIITTAIKALVLPLILLSIRTLDRDDVLI